jgi:hypothetical protein
MQRERKPGLCSAPPPQSRITLQDRGLKRLQPASAWIASSLTLLAMTKKLLRRKALSVPPTPTAVIASDSDAIHADATQQP